MKKTRKYISKLDALKKLQRYCAYQDRCHKEVRTKLLDLGIYGDDLEEIIAELIAENFLNELRFAKSYARGKFRMKRWGKNRIKQELKLRKLSAYCIKKALLEIEEEDYLSTINDLIEKKIKDYKEPNEYKLKNKIALYLINKGYESSIAWQQIRLRFPAK